MKLHCVFETADGCTGQQVIEADRIPTQIERPCSGWRKLDLKHAKKSKQADATGIKVRVYEFTRSDAGTFYYREVLR